ncbi:hypothetical protein BU25DRAFT_409672 [Macroventuria anomochaeta]|uniref:Uncharacterized protein n=1 Tax=Macroventuria anomochaeta TaxID=301207 RepID=A0ACB6S3N2_9PLEO|nr:uncharacterized protein BU25DRAFT_409672 [Macroventuria anomochaeta]KAF2628638.1 hypothetical protein BU25DRAFT_409672 [Macroventuria anomochaeta]
MTAKQHAAPLNPKEDIVQVDIVYIAESAAASETVAVCIPCEKLSAHKPTKRLSVTT